jgi:hypothetical protein
MGRTDKYGMNMDYIPIECALGHLMRHHSAIITLQAITPAFKMIENHTGQALMQTVKMQVVAAPG